MLAIKKLLSVIVLTVLSFHAYADLIIHHNEGDMSIGKFDLKIVSINGKICFEKNNISEFIPQLTLTQNDLLPCNSDELYRVYGILKVWGYGYKVFYSNKFVDKNSECTISHNRDGYFGSKLTIICEE